MQEDTNTVKSYSPTQLAVRRLMGNRLALLGLALVTVIVLSVLFGTVCVSTTPTETRLWIGAQPPGFEHPHCQSEMLFRVGEKPALERPLRKSQELLFRVRRTVRQEVRVSLRRGRINTITQGAEALPELDLGTLGVQAHEVLETGELGRVLPTEKLLMGEAPPEGVFADRQRVLILAWDTPGPERAVRVSLAEGVVRAVAVEEDGAVSALDSATVKGADVVQVLADGRPLVLRHPLGTDELGRDLLLRVVNGGRVSLLVGLVATLVSVLVGVSYGATAGYVGGRIDGAMMRLVDVLYGLPFVFLVLLLMVVFDRNIVLLFVALGLVQWLTMARIVRGQVLSLREMDFISAARMSGASGAKIVFRHLIPHTLGPVIVYATMTVPVVILEESFLAFIGLPVQYQGTTLDSWGSLVHLGMSALGESGQMWWLLVFPSLAMVLTLFGLNCLGDGLRDSFDPKGGPR